MVKNYLGIEYVMLLYRAFTEPIYSPKLGSNLAVKEAVPQVIVYHADALHISIAGDGSHEFESSTLQVPGHGVRFRRRNRHILPGTIPGIAQGLVVREPPDVVVEGAELLLHPQERGGVGYSGVDFSHVADDARVG